MNRENKRFPLNDVQFAYMVGRNENIYLGGNSTHFYVEFDSNLDMDKFEEALNKTILMQPMLRAVIHENGTQDILEKVPEYKMSFTDISDKSKADQEKIILNYRKEHESRIFPLEKWPMFEFSTFKTDKGKHKLILDFDMMIIDGYSTELLVQNVLMFYDNPYKEIENFKYDFSDYIYDEKIKAEQYSEKDTEFWMEKLKDFPIGPELPVKVKLGEKYVFSQKEYIIPEKKWSAVKNTLKERKVLPSIYLLTVYAKMLSVWSNQKRLGINMTLSDRRVSNVEKNRVYSKLIGDFTKILPIDFDFSEEKDILTLCSEAQRKAGKYKRHINCNIIDFMNKVGKENGLGDKPAFPVVFTGMMYDMAKSGWNRIGDRTYQISETPQLLLDNQVTERNGSLIVRWDYVKNCFDAQVIDDMYDNFISDILSLIEDSSMIEEKIKKIYEEYNNTKQDFSFLTIQESFLEQAEKNPAKTALVCGDKTVTYEELNKMANQTANKIKELYGCKKIIAIEAQRSVETVVNILAVLKTGGCYVPIAANVPVERRKYIIDNSKAEVVLTDSFYNESCQDCSVEFKPDTMYNASDEAYVIYTSGTTGRPKGVVITQEAVMNTILDINSRFKVTDTDKIIGISSFGFDLSVYDLAGSLTTGAELIIQDNQENISGIKKNIDKYNVSVWNTVPAIMQLLVDELSENYINTSLRLVMLSGDWIPVELPEKIKKYFPKAEVISLGGATEASIWSIYYPINEVRSDWKTIPYGYPLANQKIYLLNYEGNLCPMGVPGEICIGGIGVAEGYQNNPEKTLEQFKEHPSLGRLYYTGDIGIFNSKGYVEFVGRNDNQIKLHGYRIELGEIESSLKKCPGIKNSAANIIETSDGVKKIAAYYVPQENEAKDETGNIEFFEDLDKAMEEVTDNLPKVVSVENYKVIVQELENISLSIMMNAFEKLDFFTTKGEVYALEDLFTENKVMEKYRKLIYQWADSLAKYGYIEKMRNRYYRCKVVLKNIDIDSMHQDVMNKEGADYWKGSFEFLTLCNKHVTEILKADVNPLTILFPDGSWDRADNIYRFNPVAEYNNNLMAEVVENYIKNHSQDEPIKILEFGAGTGGTSAAVLSRISSYNVEYTYTDLTTFFTEEAKERFAKYPFVKYGLFNIDEYPQIQGFEAGSYDIILGANVLHDAKNIKHTLKNLRTLLKNDGILSVLEVTTNKLYHKVSIGLIDGFSGYNDERLIQNEPLLSAEQWKKAMTDCNYTNAVSYPGDNKAAEAFEQHVIIACADKNVSYFDTEKLKDYLAGLLPHYMVPDQIYPLDSLVLSANGKVNKKNLPYIKEVEVKKEDVVMPETETEKLLCSVIKESLEIDELGVETNIFTIGADSLKSIHVLSKLKNYDINLTLSELYKYPTVRQMAAYVDENREEKVYRNEDDEVLDFKISPEDTYKPFPLSDLQESYYIGSHETEGFNSIPTAGYVEIECKDYEHEKMCSIINKMIERHAMLRCYIDDNGMQHILKDNPEFEMPVIDVSAMNEKEIERYMKNVRKEMLSTRLDLSKAPLMSARVTKLNEGTAILHVYADGQIMDGWSFETFFAELGKLYKNPELELEPLKVTFRDYIMYREALKSTKKYEEDKEYWCKKIKTLPKAGVLPLLKPIEEIKDVVGIQVECGLPIDEWRILEKKSRSHGISPFSVLFASFAYAISRWNNKQSFLLNIPEFYRPDFHEDIFKIIGECASFLLFEVENKKDETFLENAIRTQRQIMELKDHHSFSGMEVTREIYKHNNGYNEVLAPIVFGMLPETPHFEENFIEIERELLKVKYQENHTSQVWIDVNTCVYSDRIEFNFNSLEGLIDKKVLESVAAMQKYILKSAVNNDDFWNKPVKLSLPERDEKIINASNDTAEEFKFEGFSRILDKRFTEYADRICIRTEENNYTYNQVEGMVKCLAAKIRENGYKPGDYIAVHMGKGVEQIISILAVIYAGAVYVPIEFTMPEISVCRCLNKIDVKLMLTCDDKKEYFEDNGFRCIVPKDEELDEKSVFEAVDTEEDSLIAIIHTSGSTGIPKAVMVGQKGLLNSIIYTNKRFAVKEYDVAIALTNAAHDMSMYDIFGMIYAGGSMSVPMEKYAKDPEEWLRLIKKHKVTIWNSVPAMPEMILELGTELNSTDLESLRLMILGGDYLKVEIAKKLKDLNINLKLVNVGGPTETTLWNIMHEVSEKDFENGIPYGKPIANTKYYVLNENKEQLPLGVSGLMYCAGVGVTKGYCNDEETTAEKYIVLPETGELVYNTGDLGHYNEDGELIFDGREDMQVEINGKRIELEGIANVAMSLENIYNAKAIVTEDKQIYLFYVAESHVDDSIIRNKILETLPKYMVPKLFIHMDKMPLTTNGKINRKFLLEYIDKEAAVDKQTISKIGEDVRSNVENHLIEILEEMLGVKVNVDSDFFMMGGNSIIAMKLLARIKNDFKIDISITDIFETSTVLDMEELVISKMES